jgi:branched-chain amino acid transport system substrate-binding protein
MLRPSSLAACLCVVLLLSCSDGGDGDRLEVNIGVVQSLSGDGAVYGRSGIEGIELAIRELEAADSNLEIDYTIVDDQSSVEGGVQAYEDFVEDGVTAIIGPSLSNVGFEALKVADDAEVPAISPMTTATGIAAIGEYVFRIALAEEVSLPALIARVAEDTPITRGALFYDGADAYSRTSAEAVRRGMAAIGAELVVEVDLSRSPALDAAGSQPALSEADVILIPTFTETAAPVLTALRASGFDQPAIGGEALASLDLVRLAGEAADGTYVASTWHPDAPGALSRAFVEDYTEAYGHPPEHFAAESYTAVYLLIDALRRAGTDEASAVRDALAATSDFETILGSLSMSPEGDAVFEPVFQQFRDGEIVVLP